MPKSAFIETKSKGALVGRWLVFAAAVGLVFLPGRALAAAILSGEVQTADGTPIAQAAILLAGNGPAIRATTNERGHFEIASARTGTYIISVHARGYVDAANRTVTLDERYPIDLRFTLPREQVSTLTTIADVESNGAPLLSRSSAPTVNVKAQVYAAQGVSRTSDILGSQLSTTIVPILAGGGLNAPAAVALRGPDPSETLVDVDGHQVNNGNTGDFDLSLLDPADLQDVQVVYGIAPSALYGPNTLGGALNVVTLQPTSVPHVLERLSIGSFDTNSGTLAATGTDERFGYAFSLHRMVSGGQLANYTFPNTSDDDGNSHGSSPIGNDMTATSSLANLRYLFGNGGFVGVSLQNQAAYRDISATLSSECAPGDCTLDSGAPNTLPLYSNYSGSAISSNDDAYGLDLQLPLGRTVDGVASTTATFRHQTSLVSQSVTGDAADSSPYLYNDRDLIADDTLELDHSFAKGSIALKFAVTGENLETQNVLGTIDADSIARTAAQSFERAMLDDDSSGDSGVTQQQLRQTQRWIGLSYEFDPAAKLHYSLASYYSDFSSFGHSFDPRLGLEWTPTADTAVRASIGNTFQSPQLPTFIVPGPNVPIPVVDGYATIGNAGATAERATSMDLGAQHVFHIPNHTADVSLDLYRTNLHNGVMTYFGPQTCAQDTVTLAQKPPCLSYPVNVAHQVYQGLELRTAYQLHAKTQLHFDYDIDSAYIVSFPGSTAADDVVPYVQDLGVPLHKAVLTLEHDPSAGLSYYAGLLYEGRYNELNLPPFAALRAGVTWHLPHVDIALTGENLTNAYDFLITREAGGLPYPLTTGPSQTDAYPLAGRRFSLIFTHRT